MLYRLNSMYFASKVKIGLSLRLAGIIDKSRDHWQDPVMSLLTGLYIRMHVACPLQKNVRDFGLVAALSSRMLGCC